MSSFPTKHNTKIVMLDNLDSFTYNLVDEFQSLGFEPVVYRNTLSADFILEQIDKIKQNSNQEVLLVLSPGPGEPSSAGCLMELIQRSIGNTPMLGICLGHQALIQHFGGTIGRAPEIVHGKSSSIEHNQAGAFKDIATPLPVARYHSLVATKMSEQLELTAYFTTDNGEKLPMAIEHQQAAIIGFQFHPESILTTYGSNLLAQSIEHLLFLASKHLASNEQGTSDV
ncbi:MAG: aminodeoxychorismate/anthranilate synthase component II [Colwellia sp.]|nr:aminodeoxychorismate/anthranilate synthase component II [Colwellia sp.]